MLTHMCNNSLCNLIPFNVNCILLPSLIGGADHKSTSLWDKFPMPNLLYTKDYLLSSPPLRSQTKVCHFHVFNYHSSLSLVFLISMNSINMLSPKVVVYFLQNTLFYQFSHHRSILLPCVLSCILYQILIVILNNLHSIGSIIFAISYRLRFPIMIDAKFHL